MKRARILLLGQVLPAVLSATILAVLIYHVITDGAEAWLHTLDTAVAYILLTEWLFKWARSTDKMRFVRKYWWLLIAAIPVSNDITEALRSLRILPLVLLLRTGVKLTSIDMSASRNLK